MESQIVLLVENNLDEQELLLFACQQSNMAVDSVIVEDGVEALDYLFATGAFTGRNPQQMPSLVFLDLHLPKLNGLEVLRRLRADERTRDLPVIMLAISGEPKDITNSYLYGCNSYIRKSVNFTEFQTTISQLLSRWLSSDSFSMQLN